MPLLLCHPQFLIQSEGLSVLFSQPRHRGAISYFWFMQQVVEGWYDPAANLEKAEGKVEAKMRPSDLRSTLTSACWIGECIDAETCDGVATGEN